MSASSNICFFKNLLLQMSVSSNICSLKYLLLQISASSNACFFKYLLLQISAPSNICFFKYLHLEISAPSNIRFFISCSQSAAFGPYLVIQYVPSLADGIHCQVKQIIILIYPEWWHLLPNPAVKFDRSELQLRILNAVFPSAHHSITQPPGDTQNSRYHWIRKPWNL